MLDRKPVISIITACYNSESLIDNCIRSVLQQTYPYIQYIIIDGNSTDGTCDIIRKYSEHIDCFITEPDDGIYSAWNKGIRNATGDYVFMLNSDDTLFDTQVIGDVAKFISAHESPAVVYGKVQGFEPSSGYTYLDGKPTRLEDFIFKMHYCTPAAFVHRGMFKKMGLFSEEYRISSDYEWAIRLFKQCASDELIFYDRIICKFRVDGCSNENYLHALEEVSSIVRRHFNSTAFLEHVIYIKMLLLIKRALPLFRYTGVLSLWRRLKKWRRRAERQGM